MPPIPCRSCPTPPPDPAADLMAALDVATAGLRRCAWHALRLGGLAGDTDLGAELRGLAGDALEAAGDAATAAGGVRCGAAAGEAAR